MFLFLCYSRGKCESLPEATAKSHSFTASTTVKNEEIQARLSLWNATSPNALEDNIDNKGSVTETINQFLRQAIQEHSRRRARQAVKFIEQRWANGIIPYTVSAEYTAANRIVITNAMKEFEQISCIRFIPRTSEIDYIDIMPNRTRTTCYSSIGKAGGRQITSLIDDCLSDQYLVQHELMHAVGFGHEQSRTDRDQYIEYLPQNVENGFAAEFMIYDSDFLGLPYDYKSIMQYSGEVFAKPGTVTMRPVASARAQGITLDINRQFSPTDIQKLNIIANCPGYVTTTLTPLPTIPAPSSECVDRTTDCVTLVANGLCTQPLYQSLMSTQCRRSCSLCSGTAAACVDTDNRCAQWQQQNFCTSTFYSAEMRRQMCAKTCGLC
uniref:Metalloendopeptidase n=1 Tax=Plectus sambesii TaxID=2011161 RepID=A0A914XF38_9BILA